jgi:hypothetical protein
MIMVEQDYHPVHSPTLGDFLLDCWRLKVWIIAGLFSGLILAGVFIFSAVPHYQAKAIIAPAVPMGAAGGTSNAAGLSNEDIFALRFVFQHINAGQGSDFQRFETIYNGASVASVLLKDQRVLAGLRKDVDFKGGRANDHNWTAQRLSEYLHKQMKLQSTGMSSARQLTYFHPDPQFAVYLIGAVHHIADGLIRKAVREEARARVDYLNTAIAQTSNPEHKRALTNLLMEQERVLMLVSIDQPYAAALIEPPITGIRPDWPDIPLVLILFTGIGALLGFIVGSMRAGHLKYERE